MGRVRKQRWIERFVSFTDQNLSRYERILTQNFWRQQLSISYWLCIQKR